MKTPAPHLYPRGVALLLVLGLLLLAVTAAATLARLSTTSRLTEAQSDRLRRADDLLVPARDTIALWLASRADSVVLPDDATSPRVLIADDQLAFEDEYVNVRITAWDQQGMLPLSHAQPGSPLRASVPSELRTILDGLRDQQSIGIAGLDRVPHNTSNHSAIYPSADDQNATAFGSLIATHNPLPAQLFPGQRGVPMTPMINVNTAPRALLDPALHAAGRGGVEAIFQARSEGRAAPLPASLAPRTSANSQSPRTSANSQSPRIGFSGQSDVWSFRVDIALAHTAKSWWLVYTRPPAPPYPSSNTPSSRTRTTPSWRLVQSHVLER